MNEEDADPTVRDLFAASALPALMTTYKDSLTIKELVKVAYEIADAMILERNKTVTLEE